MSLVNFTLPYQSATPTPFFYGGQNGGQPAVNNLRLNAVLPVAPAPNFNGQESFQNEPYIPPAAYQQKQQQHRQRTTLNRQASSSTFVEQSSFSSTQDTRYANYNQDFRRTQPRQQQQQMRPPQSQENGQDSSRTSRMPEQETYPERPNGYTRVNGGNGPGTKTSVHAILDYDDDFDDYYDEEPDIPRDAHVTPIQGPIFVKNGSVPVVPLYSYPQLNNGSFVQIPEC